MIRIIRLLWMVKFLWGYLRVYPKLVRGWVLGNIFKKHPVRFLEISLDWGCNATCDFCAAKEFTPKKGEKLTTEQYKDVITQAATMGIPQICLIGGEPLVQKNVFELIAHIKKVGSLPQIATNGTLCTPEMLRKLKDAGLFIISFSVHDMDGDVHDGMLNYSGSHKTIMEAIKYSKEIGMIPQVCTTITSENMNNGALDRLLDFAKSQSIALSVNIPMPVGKSHHNINNILLNENDLKRVKDFCEEHFIASMDLQNNFRGYGCPAGNSYMYLTPHGDVMPCGFIPISFGNVHNKGLKSIHENILTSPLFADVGPTCLSGESPEFAEQCLDPIYDSEKGVPLAYEDHPHRGKPVGDLQVL